MKVTSDRMQLVIDSDTVMLNNVETFIEEVFSNYGLSVKNRNKVLLCVKEAVTNSIIHGNQSDSNKKVTIKVTKCHEDVYFRVKDEGKGFDYLNLKDPTAGVNIREECGRGIFLIKNLSDGIIFRDLGNIVEFKISFGESG
jgi:serine/threonine-protein kinase RsbW